MEGRWSRVLQGTQKGTLTLPPPSLGKEGGVTWAGPSGSALCRAWEPVL